jgi:hypothetical protein|tara:strand:- start:2482 stop:2913 length:432 start_codon:yes stop_codon:yes gene_type:complete
MTKARDLANLIAAGNPLADGAISVAEISDLTASVNELNKLDGVTASTAELNKLAGLTSSTADLNNVAGINSSVQTQLDAKASSTALTTAINNLGTASALNVGTGANQIMQLDSSGKAPAVDGSNLTGISAGVSAAKAHFLATA